MSIIKKNLMIKRGSGYFIPTLPSSPPKIMILNFLLDSCFLKPSIQITCIDASQNESNLISVKSY